MHKSIVKQMKIESGERLKQKRLDAGLSQNQLALMVNSHKWYIPGTCNVMNQGKISAFERGYSLIHPSVAKIIEDILTTTKASSLLPEQTTLEPGSLRTLDALSEMELDSNKIFKSTKDPKRRIKILKDGKTIRVFYLTGATDGVSNSLELKLDEHWVEVEGSLTWQEALVRVMAGGSVDCEYNGIIHTYTANSPIMINHLRFGTFYDNKI